MNGLISRKSIRFSLVASACLLSGFVSGSHFHGINYEALFPKTEINFSKISWISSAIIEEKIAIAPVVFTESELSNKEIKLDEFQLAPTTRLVHKQRRISHHNFEKLSAVVAKINSYDLFKDYRFAFEKMHQKFLLVMSHPPIKADSVVIASSSAIQNEVPRKMNIQKMSIHLKSPKYKKNEKITIIAEKVAPAIAVSAEESEKTLENNKNIATGSDESNEKIETVKSSAAMSTNIQAETKKSADETFGNKVENQLLEQHIQYYIQNSQKKNTVAKPVYSENKNKPVVNQPEDKIDHQNDVQNIPNDEAHGLVSNKEACKVLPKLHLIKPIQNEAEENTQTCATRNTWISKTWRDEGWAKVETEGYFPLLTYYPQVNSNKTLLLDQNSIALLAIKSGVHFSKGMGMILGVLPQGYKIEFSGRAEEVQHFELNAKKYFIILNVEPGAGVIELVSEKNQTENASVFTPVLGDTITYLDLASPIAVNIPVKIIKDNHKKEELPADLAGLTVGISTQTEIQAKTKSNGTAMLANVKMVPGYPVFLDVSSKRSGEKSYQYRYQLNQRTRAGVFILKQYSEELIYEWFKQIKTGLSEQSGYIFGQFGNKIDAFRNHYTVKVESITEKFGLEAKNYTVLCDQKLSEQYPLEGLCPRFLSVQVPEGLTQAHLVDEKNQIIQTSLIPVSPRVINVVSE